MTTIKTMATHATNRMRSSWDIWSILCVRPTFVRQVGEQPIHQSDQSLVKNTLTFPTLLRHEEPTSIQGDTTQVGHNLARLPHTPTITLEIPINVDSTLGIDTHDTFTYPFIAHVKPPFLEKSKSH